ncbi:MAG: type II toxin-antitoxin system VapC family toxin [Verrucomicrobiae bacterium]|nr:type II toxin-antitoxin system VapC family toxin [Verrucomicrobiae bacterium]
MPATGNVLLDTTIVIAHFRNDPALDSKLAQAATLYLPWAVLGELYYGAYKSDHRAKTLRQVRIFLNAVVLLTPSEITAELYGQIKSTLAVAGTPIPENDIWIAALAREHRLPLATRDDHFTIVTGLTVLKW